MRGTNRSSLDVLILHLDITILRRFLFNKRKYIKQRKLCQGNDIYNKDLGVLTWPVCWQHISLRHQERQQEPEV